LTILVQGPPSIVAEEAAFHAAPHDPAALKTQSDSAIEHIRLAAINIHHLCNEWRPIQARETMKLMMRNQIEDRKDRIAEMRRYIAMLPAMKTTERSSRFFTVPRKRYEPD
jgi:mediator of RNA polymerase II transcription subunit 7